MFRIIYQVSYRCSGWFTRSVTDVPDHLPGQLQMFWIIYQVSYTCSGSFTRSVTDVSDHLPGQLQMFRIIYQVSYRCAGSFTRSVTDVLDHLPECNYRLYKFKITGYGSGSSNSEWSGTWFGMRKKNNICPMMRIIMSWFWRIIRKKITNIFERCQIIFKNSPKHYFGSGAVEPELPIVDYGSTGPTAMFKHLC